MWLFEGRKRRREGGEGSEPASELRQIDSEEMKSHATPDSCWVSIDGLVYDVTNFHHPGGNDRLFDRGGKDVTKAFGAIRHSDAAHKHLRRLLIGQINTSQAPAPAEASLLRTHSSPPQGGATESRAPLRYLKAGATHRLPRPGEPVWSTRCRGFLPAYDPVSTLGPPYEVLTELVAALPASLASGDFRALVDQQAARLAALGAAVAAEQEVGVLERVHGLFGYIGKGYVHGGAAADGTQRVPAFLSHGWLEVSRRLERHPTIDYADCVTYNWERVDKQGPMTPENVRILNRFTGLLDEEWFLKTHVILESEASGVVSAVYDACQTIKANDIDRLLPMLGWLEQAMAHLAGNCLALMFERSADDGYKCEPDIFFHRFRPYISSWVGVFEGQGEPGEVQTLRAQLAALEAMGGVDSSLPDLSEHKRHIEQRIGALLQRGARRLCGPSGAMSGILPLCDAFLQIEMSSPELGAMLKTFGEYMPRPHRDVVREAAACSVRPLVLELIAQRHEQAETLVQAYNAVVRQTLDFRWRHLSYIEQYIVKPSGGNNAARGTGGTHALHYLQQHINDTEDSLIHIHYDDGDADADGGAAGGQPSAANRPLGLRTSASARSLVSLGAASRLWAVGALNGLLPTRPPLAAAALPPAWCGVAPLVARLPAACVPPATFRAAVVAAREHFPRDATALRDEEQRERARSLLAFVVAGWEAGGDAKPPPEWLGALFSEVSATLRRSTRLTLTDWLLYNWQPRDGMGAWKGGRIGGGTDAGRGGGGGGAATNDHEPSRAMPISSPTPPPSVPLSKSNSAPAGLSPSQGERGATSATRAPLARTASEHGDTATAAALGRREPPPEEAAEVLLPWLQRTEHGAKFLPVQPALRFLCLEEEDWFLRLHVTLAGEAGGVIGAINRCLQAGTANEQVRALQLLEQAIEALVRVHVDAGIGMGAIMPPEALAPRRPPNIFTSPKPTAAPAPATPSAMPPPAMPLPPAAVPLPLPRCPHAPLSVAPPPSASAASLPQTASTSPLAVVAPPPSALAAGGGAPPIHPRLLMPRLHRFLPHVAALELDRRTQQAVRIYCATGIVQPCLLYLFGASYGTHAMQRFREWQMGGEDGGGGGSSELPTEHIEYCAACCEHTSIREQVEAAVGVKNLSVQDVGRLELAHNGCVDALRRLLSKRLELVQLMFGTDTLEADWEQELSHLADARLSLLMERREMVGALDGQPTRASFYKRHPEERGR